MEKFNHILKNALNYRASDLHLSVGLPPILRIDGELRKENEPVLTSEELIEFGKSITNEELWNTFKVKKEIDFSFCNEQGRRFRVNIFYQSENVSIAIRPITENIPSLNELKLPDVLTKIVNAPHGLILVTGPTGSGKSTTLASMVDYINETQRKHIITLEDPIEYIHSHKNSVIQQREVGRDTDSFANGLRASLRQDPDIILVGELRDLETISTAITAAETGHLVLATLHTSSAVATVERIVDVFPADQQGKIRLQFANVFVGAVSQRLFPRMDAMGRVVATEILLNNPAVANLIRSDKLHQIPSIMQTSKEQGMHTFQSSLMEFVKNGVLSMNTVAPYVEERVM
ncbi:type IV pilus twitching motility protein PilT [Bacillus sp. JJ664]